MMVTKLAFYPAFRRSSMLSVLPMVYLDVIGLSVQVIDASSEYMTAFEGREPVLIYSVPIIATWHKEMS